MEGGKQEEKGKEVFVDSISDLKCSMPMSADSLITSAMSSKIQKTRKEKDKERDKERKLSQQEPNNERLKTVVRRLPPNLPEGIFWQSVQSWVTEDTAVWKTYYPGKVRKRYAWSFWNLWINQLSYHVQCEQGEHPISSIYCIQDEGTTRIVQSRV